MSCESPKTISINPEESYEKNAEIILKEWFPDKKIDKEKHLKSLAMVVFDLVGDLWIQIQRTLSSAGIDELRQAAIRRSIIIMAWNQVMADFEGDCVKIVDSKEKENNDATAH